MTKRYCIRDLILPPGYSATRVQNGKHLYVAYQRPDETLSGGFNSVEMMVMAAEADYRKRSLIDRPCILCAKEFKSEGAHHRMCNTCRDTASEFVGC